MTHLRITRTRGTKHVKINKKTKKAEDI